MQKGASTTTTSAASSQDGPAPRLPTEVCGRIIDHLSAGLDLNYLTLAGNPDLLALPSCALVCRDWYFHTWYHLRRRVHLRDRNDVLSLSRTLRERPRLRGVVQHVVISGQTSAERSVIQHLAMFAVMLAGRLPKLSVITIRDAEWTVGSMRMEDVGYLATFDLVHALNFFNVNVPSIAHLARLISALPGLRDMNCYDVECSQKQPVSPVSPPLNSAHLETLVVLGVAPAIQDLFVRISQASRLRALELGVDDSEGLTLPSGGSRSQTLLDASAASVEVLTLSMFLGSSVDSDKVDSTVERHLSLSRHESLRRLVIILYYPFNAWSWIPHIVSRIPSKHLIAISVLFWFRADHAADDLDGLVTMMEEDGILVRLDDILQAECFADIAPGGICLGFDNGKDWTPPEKLFGTESSFRERCNRWDELIRRKMPRCNGRGILITVYGFEERDNWNRNMGEIHEARKQQQAKTGVEVQQEDDTEHAPDTSG
ncbi:uncharacterized protein C8Q71DRAFT_56758 [Rhodofomes roseus]|uniref:F-box domain-containing protein n=1 Tax=Rhodofomes roseus TaxID=34475 RepID=A0ABQ8KGP4_9APHY|nr:uncharacterized protein C8Q71DRAFT_56758 [Rhodofomes roseus]KAH9836740.1 hypothetical protein C8Q71DRAFT_56758 [Rhodofomes roseus]